MSPFILTRVFPAHEETEAKELGQGWLASVVKHDYNGSLDIRDYPQYQGGMF